MRSQYHVSTILSPDGKWIAFVSGRDGNADIDVVDLSGKNIFRLTTDPGDDWFPVWGPAEE
jgi:TolB protein